MSSKKFLGGENMKAYGKVQPLQMIDIRTFNGLDSDAPFVAGKTNLIAGTGWTLENYPTLQTRKRLLRIPGVGGTNNFGVGLYSSFIDYEEIGKIIGVVGGSLYDISTGTYITTLSWGGYVSFTKFKGNLGATNLILSNGIDLKKYNGTLSNLLPGGYPVAPPYYYVTEHQNRLFCTDIYTKLMFSALNMADDWVTVGDAGSIEIENQSDSVITALYSMGDRLYIFRKDSFYELLGTGPSNFRLIKVSDTLGAANNQSVTSIQNVLYFANLTGVYSYLPGGTPQKISQPIHLINEFDYISPSLDDLIIDTSRLGTDGNFLYFTKIYANANSQYQVFQYSPKINQWIGYDNLNYNAYGMINQKMAVFIRDSSNYISFCYVRNRQFSASDTDNFRDQPYFAFFPIVDSGTLNGKIRSIRVKMRIAASGSYKVYLANKYSAVYDNQKSFITNSYVTTTADELVEIYSGSGTDYYPLEQGVSFIIPSTYLKNRNYLTIGIGGTKQFVLHDLAVEYLPIPSN